jgi:hypothetical protein
MHPVAVMVEAGQEQSAPRLLDGHKQVEHSNVPTLSQIGLFSILFASQSHVHIPVMLTLTSPNPMNRITKE